MIKNLLGILLALIYSICYSILGPMTKAQNYDFDKSYLVPFLVCFIVCSAVNIFLFNFIPRIRFNKVNKWLSAKFEPVSDTKLLLIVWAGIFVMWIPVYLITFPGVLSYDIISQTDSALGTITNNHHPVLHTWLLRVFLRLGLSVFGAYEYGYGVLSLIQMIILSYSLARLVVLLRKKQVYPIVIVITAVLSALWFENACLSVTMVKDTLHAAFLILFVCHFVQIVSNPYEYQRNRRNLFLFPVIVFFMCAFRNNGFHIYLFCLAGLGLLRINKLKKIKTYIPLLICVLIPIIIFKLYSGPFFKAVEIEQGDVREAFSVPIQQLQRVGTLHWQELTEEQDETLTSYIIKLDWGWLPESHRDYDPFFADPAKSCFYSYNYHKDPTAFWKFYLSTGMQYPGEYIKAFLSNTAGYWYPGYYDYSYVMYDNYPSDKLPQNLERKSVINISTVDNMYRSLCGADIWRKIPGFRLFFVSGFTPWIMLYILILSWKKKGFFTEVLPLYLPLIAQLGIMFLSPMSSFRYSWPFYLILPISFIGIFNLSKERE